MIAAATGTFVPQRGLTDPEVLAHTFSPSTLRWLDATELTDVFHAWWFATLLALLGINIVFASLERFPSVWRYFERPYVKPEPHFLAGLPIQKEIPIRSGAAGLDAAERAFRRLGFKPRRIGQGAEASLYVERYRFARLAAYIVHASLLLVFLGGIIDAVQGYRGFMALGPDQQTNEIEMRNGTRKQLPFSVRCLAAGQENYTDGTPRRYWSRLVVLENGAETRQKEIAVNDPLVYRGLRFYQSSYGSTGDVAAVVLTATPKAHPEAPREIELRPDQPVALDSHTTVRLGAFVPDFVLVGNQIESRSDQPNNPAIQLRVKSAPGVETKVWLFPRYPEFSHAEQSPYTFQFRDLQTGYYTGLQVSYEPGQWVVWAGVLMMAVGLALAFYFVHLRFWAVVVSDDRGRRVLWVGASASKNRDELEERFHKLVTEIQASLETRPASLASQPAVSPARI